MVVAGWSVRIEVFPFHIAWALLHDEAWGPVSLTYLTVEPMKLVKRGTLTVTKWAVETSTEGLRV